MLVNQETLDALTLIEPISITPWSRQRTASQLPSQLHCLRIILRAHFTTCRLTLCTISQASHSEAIRSSLTVHCMSSEGTDTPDDFCHLQEIRDTNELPLDFLLKKEADPQLANKWLWQKGFVISSHEKSGASYRMGYYSPNASRLMVL